ncbi:MAG: leucyl/phenylalanyl-tRNA--protein transferase [Holophagales bacterium]|jgi:leucyl/phenylalanyl-tRNA--protein transferase|nr:leucyl/phenylalanyl-tRNA--protein transferase [Holophagales bacterium]
MPVYLLSSSTVFPDPEEAEPNGLLAVGGDLSVKRLVQAYAHGIFPWFGLGEPVLWWSPPERAVFLPEQEHFSKRTMRALKRIPFEIRMDTAFKQVINCCSEAPRKGQEGTWITHEMIKAYTDLHHAGYAHSIETYLDNRLIGGLYGISLGSAFFGESMFNLVDYASRAAFAALCEKVWNWGFHFIDGQLPNENLNSLGAKTMPRRVFLERLESALKNPTKQGSWTCIVKQF